MWFLLLYTSTSVSFLQIVHDEIRGTTRLFSVKYLFGEAEIP